MISKTTYHELLESKQKISLKQLADLAELVNDFPYSQNIRQLFLKALYQNESVKFESELKKTAAYTSNRSHLKKFILDDSFEKNEKLRVVFTATDKKSNLSTTETDESTSTGDKKQIDQLTDQLKKDEFDKNTTKESTITNTKDSPLNDEVLSQAINASISMEVGRKSKPTKTVTKNIPLKENKEEVAQKKSFIQWIKHYDEEQQEKAVDRAEFKEKAALLIDEFIKTQPKIKPKKGFYSPIDMADKSLRDSDEVISETLANILFVQGNRNKAIKMYQSLSLKFPEKKAYFANKIEIIIISQKDKS